MAADSESWWSKMEGGSAESPLEMAKGMPAEELPPTTYSLLDMDLTFFSELAQPLAPQRAVQTDECHGGPQPETSALKETYPGDGIRQHLQEIVEEHRHHRQELKGNMAQMIKDITNHTKQETKALTDLFQEQQKEIIKHVDKRLEYLQSQFNASLGWRLKNYHTDLLKDLFSVLTPMSGAVAHLQEGLSHCRNTIHSLSEELTASKVTTTITPASGQSSSEGLQGEKPLLISQRPRLQSTVHPGMADVNFGSPGGSTIHGEVKNRVMGKSPVKLQFPTFGGLNDAPDPLQYLERCDDFLALTPLTDEELLATLRNVLHGTARDWWDVGRHKIHTWKEFQHQFRAAFLSEDYEDELAERVRNRVQGDGESIRDFAYMYQSLCKRWKPQIEEEEILKMILKNINPQLASQLRSSRVTSVNALVRLGQQLEKDRVNQLQYEQKKNLLGKTPKPATSESAARSLNTRENPVRTNQPSQNRPSLVYCWRCKESHAPASCPQWTCNRASSRPSQQQAAKTTHGQDGHSTLGSLTHSGYLGDATFGNTSSSPLGSLLPCQLRVPLNIGPWKGTAILDTGLSYTLINENVWSGIKRQQDVLKPWTRGPLYLADGEGRQHLGWCEMNLTLQLHPVALPCVILPARSLAFTAVVGLDFIFISGLQFDVSEHRYWFKSNKKQQYQFLRDSAAGLNAVLPSQLAFFSAVAPVDLVPLPPCHDLLQTACNNAHLDEFGKNQLLCQLQENSDVCSETLGCTRVLTHNFSYP